MNLSFGRRIERLLLHRFRPPMVKDTLMGTVLESLQGNNARITSIAFYAIPVHAEHRFSYAVQKERLHTFIRFSVGRHQGWAEANLGRDSHKRPFKMRIRQMSWYKSLIGISVADALQTVRDRRGPRNYHELEYAEMALIDLAGRLTGKPAVELLGLDNREPIPGMYCILSDDPERVRDEAKRALEQGLNTHLKVKLFGRPDIDVAVTRAARSVLGQDGYLVGDANYGYRQQVSGSPCNELARVLRSLHAAGLSACEDPAALTPDQWITLQENVGTLDMLPDVPMRPAWSISERVKPEMGRVFNLHPSCMGSVTETATAGKRIKSWGKRLMVGDSSLVGPACSAWQQIAIGMGVDWVEAIEKPQENGIFDACVISKATARTENGRFGIACELPGFGTEIDEERLAARAADVLTY